MNPDTWPSCARCGEPVDPADSLTIRERGEPVRDWYHPNRWSGCLKAAQVAYVATLRRITERLTVTAAKIPANVTAPNPLGLPNPLGCDHGGRPCPRPDYAADHSYEQLPAARVDPDAPGFYDGPDDGGPEQLPDPFTGAGASVEAYRG